MEGGLRNAVDKRGVLPVPKGALVHEIQLRVPNVCADSQVRRGHGAVLGDKHLPAHAQVHEQRGAVA